MKAHSIIYTDRLYYDPDPNDQGFHLHFILNAGGDLGKTLRADIGRLLGIDFEGLRDIGLHKDIMNIGNTQDSLDKFQTYWAVPYKEKWNNRYNNNLGILFGRLSIDNDHPYGVLGFWASTITDKFTKCISALLDRGLIHNKTQLLLGNKLKGQSVEEFQASQTNRPHKQSWSSAMTKYGGMESFERKLNHILSRGDGLRSTHEPII